MLNLLRRLASLILLGTMICWLTIACHHSDSDPSQKPALLTNCHIVRHTVGITCIPDSPQRLVVLSQFTLANVLALGIQPIGSTSEHPQGEFPAYLKTIPAGIRYVGTEENPNLEKILFLKPDLILGKENSEALYSQLVRIAPTVLGTWESTPSWRDHFNFVAEALNRKEQAKQLWDQYDQQIRSLKIALSDRYQNQEVSVIRVYSDGSMAASAKNSFSGSILEDAGLKRPKSQDTIGIYGVAVDGLSEENLDAIDGDVLFISTFTEDDRHKLEELARKPLWRKLKAVQKRQTYFVEGEVWVSSTYPGAIAVIDDLYKYLINTPKQLNPTN